MQRVVVLFLFGGVGVSPVGGPHGGACVVSQAGSSESPHPYVRILSEIEGRKGTFSAGSESVPLKRHPFDETLYLPQLAGAMACLPLDGDSECFVGVYHDSKRHLDSEDGGARVLDDPPSARFHPQGAQSLPYNLVIDDTMDY